MVTNDLIIKSYKGDDYSNLSFYNPPHLICNDKLKSLYLTYIKNAIDIINQMKYINPKIIFHNIHICCQ